VQPGGKITWVEMKAQDGSRSKSQVELHDHFNEMGHAVITAYSAEEALDKLRAAA